MWPLEPLPLRGHDQHHLSQSSRSISITSPHLWPQQDAPRGQRCRAAPRAARSLQLQQRLVLRGTWHVADIIHGRTRRFQTRVRQAKTRRARKSAARPPPRGAATARHVYPAKHKSGSPCVADVTRHDTWVDTARGSFKVIVCIVVGPSRARPPRARLPS